MPTYTATYPSSPAKRAKWRFVLLWLVALVSAFFAWRALFAKDVTAPRLSSEWEWAGQILPEQASYQLPTDTELLLRLRSHEPVRFTIRYGAIEQVVTGRWKNITIPIQAGGVALDIVAEDAAGNQSSVAKELLGIPPLTPLLQFPEDIQPGQPFSIQMQPPSQVYGIDVKDITVSLAGHELSFFDAGASWVALAALPLEYEDQLPLEDARVRLRLSDRFGRATELEHDIIVVPNNIRLETLALSERLVNLRTADNLFYEQELVEAVYASTDAPEPLWRETFIQPIEGLTSSGYGIPRRYGVGGNVAFHSGTDIAAPVGTPIRATNDGIVVVAARDYPIRGNFTMIAHGAEVYSLYFHQNSIEVQEGQRVARGQVIGAVGNTGLSTGAHLHWEMHIGNVATSPRYWLDTLLPGL